MKKLKWRTEKRRVNDLLPYSKNPRSISDKQMSDLKKSLRKFDLVELPATDTDGKIVAGHQRVKALQILGRGDEEIEVRVPNRKLTQEEYDQYLITSNAVTGDWDFERLKSFNLDLLTDIGFDQIELTKFWDPEIKVKSDEFIVYDELQKIKKPIVQPGDLVILGDHKLLCADSTDQKAVRKLFGNDRASVIYSDPIFNIGLDYNKGVGKKGNYGGTVNDNKSAQEYKEFIRKTLVNALSVSKNDTHVFYWGDEAWVWVFQTLYNEYDIKNRRLNVWLKNNSSPTPQVAFSKVLEFCIYGTRGRPFLSDSVKNLNEVMNSELGTGNELFEEVTNVWAHKRLPSKELEHATSKPPELHEKALKRCSKPGDIILDLFSGSASTMVCAEQLKRKVYSLEIETIFCDLAVRRYEKLTGKKAKIIKRFYEKE